MVLRYAGNTLKCNIRNIFYLDGDGDYAEWWRAGMGDMNQVRVMQVILRTHRQLSILCQDRFTLGNINKILRRTE